MGKTGKNIEEIPDAIWAKAAKELGFTKNKLKTEDDKLFFMPKEGRGQLYSSKKQASIEAEDSVGYPIEVGDRVITEDETTGKVVELVMQGDEVMVRVSMGKYEDYIEEVYPWEITVMSDTYFSGN
jgi:dsDNA-specific endonuclease/ATPase MutS2